MTPRTNTPSLDALFWNKIAVTRGLMTERARVLDVGCGTGSLAIRLAPFAHQVHGLDFSPEMIRIAREKAATLGVPNVSFEVGSLDQSVPFEPGSLDGVTAYSLLHLVKDRSRTLQHIHHLLRPGGFFVSSTVCLAGSWVPYGGLLVAMRLFRQAPETVELLSAKMLIDEIQSAGFVDVSSPDVGARPEIAFIVARKAPG